MESLFQLTVASDRPVRILQITDTHLFAGKNETLLGVNTYQSYHAVLEAIQREGYPFDLVVGTGDLAQDHSMAGYQHFAQGIEILKKPCSWLPGNHDFQPAMVDILAPYSVKPNNHLLLGDFWQALLLDSQVYGMPHGELSDYQLGWLEQALAHDTQRHTLILLHHHPYPSGCIWLDQYSLRNAHILGEVLQGYPLAKTLVCGHIHQELDVIWQGRRVLATPSTCVQFKPLCANFAIDILAPGWRYLTLYSDGSLTTEVRRLNSSEFIPDLDSDGY